MSDNLKIALQSLFVVSVWLVLLIIIFAGFYISNYSMVYTHERAHQEIYESYGVESEIVIPKSLGGYTVPESNKAHYEKCDRNCEAEHNLNEIVGYNIMGFFIGIFVLFFIYILFELFFKDYLKNAFKVGGFERC